MINEQYKAMLQGKSVIRQLSEFATERGKEIGYENVFDYSLGNPSVPVPKEFNDGLVEMIGSMSSMELHGYSPSVGIASVKDAIAENLNKRYGMNYKGIHIFPTTGAAGAVAHAVRCVTRPGDEVITFAPFFPEYTPYVNGTGAVLKVVPADTENFQINFEALEKMFSKKVAAVLINTPNNPSGAVYSTETLTRLSAFLMDKQIQYCHDIFLISDEPYREIVFDGVNASVTFVMDRKPDISYLIFGPGRGEPDRGYARCTALEKKDGRWFASFTFNAVPLEKDGPGIYEFFLGGRTVDGDPFCAMKVTNK